MSRGLVLLPLFCLLLTGLAAPVPGAAEDEATFHVNVVSARSLGCSPDFFTQPDLRVRVLLDDQVILETQKAQDQDAPLYGGLVAVRASLPARLGVEVEEAEPGGFLGLGTSWVACDASPGDATRHTFEYRGEDALEVRAVGDDERAAEALLVVGHAPREPTVRVQNVTAAGFRLAWDGGEAEGHRLAHGGAGGVIGRAGAGVVGGLVDGLCDNVPFSFRLVRDASPWHLSSGDVTVTPLNLPPQPARVLNASEEGDAVRVEWESPTTHDVARYEIHAGPEGFEATSESLRATVGDSPFSTFTTEISLQPGDASIRIRTVDTGDLEAWSDAFPVGGSARTAAWPPAEAACPRIRFLPDAASGPAPPTPPTGSNPTGEDVGEPGGDAVPDATGGTQEGPSWPILGGAALVGIALGATTVLALRRR